MRATHRSYAKLSVFFSEGHAYLLMVETKEHPMSDLAALFAPDVFTVAMEGVSFAPNVAVIKDSYGNEQRVETRKVRFHGQKGYRFYAPGWRPMTFFDPCKAAAKLATHHAFVRWEV